MVLHSGGAIYDRCKPKHIGQATKATFMYDPKMMMWTRLADMQDARAYLGLVVFCGSLYAVGGEDSEGR